MHKAALIAVAGFTLMGAYYAFGTNQQLYQTTDRVADHQHEVLARNAALAGYNQAKQHLSESFTSTSIDGEFEGRDVEVTVTVDGDEADILSTGTSTNVHGEPISFQVVATVHRTTTAGVPEEAPPFLDYAILSEDDMDIRGNVNTYVYSAPPYSNERNANVHSNGALSTGGNAATIRGFGSYTTSESVRSSLFQPNYNPDGDPSVYQTAAVDIPTFDSAEFTSRVSVDQTSSGNVILPGGTLNLGGTRDDPYIWHITGNLVGSGNTVIDGYVMFIIDGDISLTGNLTVGNSGYLTGDESSIGLYAGGSVTMHGNVQVYGQIYAEGDIFFSGTPDVYGSVVTNGRADIRGTPAVHYRGASAALSTIFEEDGEERLELTAYNEW